MGLANPLSEYDRDIFKCLLAMQEGKRVETLLFVSKPGASAKLESSGLKAIADLVEKRFGLRVDVLELLPNFSALQAIKNVRLD